MYIYKIYLILFLSNLLATFSIVAVDPETGEVGSAGGSCIAGSIIISDIHPNIGAIHTQSYYLSSNQNFASTLMDQGYSPEEIINNLVLNDAQNNPGIRQYGIVDMESGGRSAAFTGQNCTDWKGHIAGSNYSIQGNILLNENVLNSMESGFLNTNGPLFKKLMAALQGANIPGADTRCLDEGISTYSAFIRVAKPTDSNDYYMDLNVNSIVPYFAQNGIWLEPIDTLQTLYDEWLNTNIEFHYGDVNEDNIIDILDLVQIVNIILGAINPSGMMFLLGDMNNDNIINIQDIILTINVILD